MDVTVMPGGRYGGWRDGNWKNFSLLSVLYPEIERKGNLICILNNAFMRNQLGNNSARIVTHYQGLPQSVVTEFDISSIAGAYLLGFAMSFMLPTFITNIVIDRHVRQIILGIDLQI
jgi:hypothetical protein